MSKTVWVQIDAYLTWAKVFEQNRDTAERARKSGVTHKGVLKGLQAWDGQYLVDVTPANEEELQKVKEVLTDIKYGGNPRYRDTDVGSGKTFQLSRKHLDKHEFKDRETGDMREFDFGGQPDIVWFNDEKGKNVAWDIETEGLIGNGTLAKVKFSVYMSGDVPSESDTVRLEKLGIINHVPYATENNGEERF